MIGAYPNEWTMFIQAGFGDRLLPVVQDKSIKISSSSGIKSLGKTPSLLNKNGEVVGIKGWTSKITTTDDISLWINNDKLGFCVNLRDEYAAIDIDVENSDIVNNVINDLHTFFNSSTFAIRTRPNSARALVPVRIIGDKPFSKVRFTTNASKDAIEVLGKGNQFIAAGTHTSGVRYEWQGRLEDIPSKTAEELFAIVQNIANKYGFSKTAKSVVKDTLGDTDINLAQNDRVAAFIRDNGLALSETPQRIDVRCPNCAYHSSGTDGDGSTSYFKAGTSGYPEGGFKCLHAHCESLTLKDFIYHLEKLGYKTVDIDSVPVLEYDETDSIVGMDGYTPHDDDSYNANLASLSSVLHKYMNKETQIKAVLPAVVAVLNCSEQTGYKIIFDTFKQQLSSKSVKTGEWHVLNDNDQIELRHFLEAGLNFTPVGREIMRDALDYVGAKNKSDSMQEYLKELLPAWDKVPRVANFFSNYCGAEDSEYSRTLSTYLWTALFGRAVSVEGIKVDISPILIGKQGSKKSTLISTLAIDPTAAGDISLRNRDDNIKRLLRGKIIVEIPELDGLSKRDIEDVKAFLTKTADEYVPKYKEGTISQIRRCLFVLTTNEEQFLTDTTGNRRFAPIKVGDINIELVKRDLLQLWAEARYLFTIYGIDHNKLERLAVQENDKAMLEDGWYDSVSEYVESRVAAGVDKFRASDILQSALGILPASVSTRETRRLASVMRALGYKQVVIKEGDRRSVRMYVAI